MSQSSERASWVKISHTTGVQHACTAVAVLHTVHSTQYSLPTVCHLDQLENISAATNIVTTQSLNPSDIPIPFPENIIIKWHRHQLKVRDNPGTEVIVIVSDVRQSDRYWSDRSWTHYYNIKFLSPDIISH